MRLMATQVIQIDADVQKACSGGMLLLAEQVRRMKAEFLAYDWPDLKAFKSLRAQSFECCFLTGPKSAEHHVLLGLAKCCAIVMWRFVEADVQVRVDFRGGTSAFLACEMGDVASIRGVGGAKVPEKGFRRSQWFWVGEESGIAGEQQ